MENAIIERLMRAAHYVICRTSPTDLGAVRLNKVLWYADMFHYRRYGQTVTGLMDYTKMPLGPVPKHIGDAISGLQGQSKIIETSIVKYAYPMRIFIANEQIDADAFTAGEIEALQEAIAFVTPMTANAASEATHDIYWEETPLGKHMSVGAAAIQTMEITEDDLEWALTA
jgi:hypothetical protein